MDKEKVHYQQEKKPVEGVSHRRDARAHCHLQIGGFIGEKGPCGSNLSL
jgi:hypothetical protein